MFNEKFLKTTIMKKAYNIPEMMVVHVQPQKMISESLPIDKNQTINEADILVKYNWGSFWDEWAGAAGE